MLMSTIPSTKTCPDCGQDKPLSQYHRHRSRAGGVQAVCKLCMRARRMSYYYRYPEKHVAQNALRRARKLMRTPNWLTDEHKAQIAELYMEAQIATILTGEPYHVDHIVPLKGETVCGLHVPWNLQVLPGAENCSKNNQFNEDDALCQTPDRNDAPDATRSRRLKRNAS